MTPQARARFRARALVDLLPLLVAADAAIDALRAQRPDLQIVTTHEGRAYRASMNEADADAHVGLACRYQTDEFEVHGSIQSLSFTIGFAALPSRTGRLLLNHALKKVLCG